MTKPGAEPRRATEPGHLSAAVHLARGTFTLDVRLEVCPAEIVAVLGPNGAGKSTLLGVLAGLVRSDTASVVLGGRTLSDGTTHVPAEARRIGLMGQDPMLFPHLTALQNIAFGPRSQGRPRRAAAATAREWLRRLDLTDFAERRPADLSGGQRQRVALARALAAEPELLLLDEPLGALDAQTAPEIRQVLRTHLRHTGTSTVLVTHDVLDAATLADRVMVLTDGRVIDSGPTATVLAAPRSDFSAALAGLNLVRATADGAARVGTLAAATTSGLSISGLAVEALADGEPASVVLQPSAVSVYAEQPVAGSPRNSWAAVVEALERGPAAIRVRARLSVAPEHGAGPAIAADVTPAAVAQLGLQPGSRVHLTVKATEVQVYRG